MTINRWTELGKEIDVYISELSVATNDYKNVVIDKRENDYTIHQRSYRDMLGKYYE